MSRIRPGTRWRVVAVSAVAVMLAGCAGIASSGVTPAGIRHPETGSTPGVTTPGPNSGASTPAGSGSHLPGGSGSHLPGGSGSHLPGGSGSATGQLPASSGQTTASTKQSAGVVLINTVLNDGKAAGTGMVIGADGLVLTNYHVVEGSTSIKVTVATTNQTYTASVIGDSPTQDVALLQLSGASGLATVALDKDGITTGQPVTAVGNSEGQGYLSAASGTITDTSTTVTVGNDVSTTGSETLHNVLQTTAAALPGDSGGPLLDAQHEVVGITTAGEQTTTRQGTTATVASWAIPITTALQVVQQIQHGQTGNGVQIGPKPYLGVMVTNVRGGGLVIEQVVSGGPADVGGLAAGDTITGIDNTATPTQSDLSQALTGYRPGQTATIHYVDAAGIARQTTVTLGSSPIN